MDKDSIIELQKLDCNCNNCAFMVRDMEKFKLSLEFHKKMQLNQFNNIKDNLFKKAKWWQNKNEFEKADRLRAEANKMKFQFDRKEASINYGNCTKFNKEVSFIPDVLQLETQDCFVHRREI